MTDSGITDPGRCLQVLWRRCWSAAVVRTRAGGAEKQMRLTYRPVGVFGVMVCTVVISDGGALPGGWDERKRRHS